VFALVVAAVVAVSVAVALPDFSVEVVAGFVVVAVLFGWGLVAAVQREQVRAVRRLEGSLDRRITDLATERLRMERLLARLPVATLLFTPDGLAYANPAGRELFPAAEADRSPQRVLTHRGLADAVVEARESGHTVRIAVERDGRHLAAVALVTAKGEVALVITDQTDAHRLDQVRRDFVVNASHELKTPVASIQALADTLDIAVGRDPDRVPDMVERLRAEAVRMGQLVRDLLDLARMEEAEADRRERVVLNDVLRAQLEHLVVEAGERNVTMQVEIPDDLGLVAVPSDVELIMTNLLENALRYNRPGGSVTVRARRDADAVVLEVIDTGLGLSEADRLRVFERFYRVDRARSRAEGGTGLGLAIVRHAAQRHGGDVSVESVLGEGSTFRVTLPNIVA